MIKILPLIFFLLSCWPTIISQQHSLSQYNVTDGLAQSQVAEIHQDSLGFLWAATFGGGVSKFDGNNFINYNENDGLGGNIVTDIAEGDNNTIYFSSSWGPVSSISGTEIKKLNDNVTGITNISYHKQTKRLYGVKEKEIFYYSNDKWEIINFYSEHKIKDFFFQQERLFFFTKNKIIEITPKENNTKTIYTSNESISEAYWNNGLIIALVHKGLFKVKNSTLTPFVFNSKLPKNIIIGNITFDQDNNIWFSTSENGVFNFIGNKLNNISSENGLPSNRVGSLFCDKQNNLWVAQNGDGILKLTATPFITYSNVEGFNNPNNFAIIKDSKNNIWVGSSSEGCYVYDGKTVTNYNTSNGLPNNTVFSIIETPNNEIWISTNKGVVQYKNKVFKTFTKKDGLINNNINCLFYDKQNRLWIGTNKGISVLENGEFTNYNEENGILNTNIHTIFQDSKGLIWIGTSNGLMKFYEGNFRIYGVIDGLCNSYVGSIIEDDNGKIWVGTDRCISKLDNEVFTPYTEKDGLNSTIIYLMNKDNYGNLWVGTNKGLDKITLDSESNITSIDFFGKNEGFYGIESNTRGTYKDNDGNLYFATIKGIFQYNNKNENLKKRSFPLYISDIKLFLKSIDSVYKSGKTNKFGVSDSIILPAENDHITFEFIGLDLTSSNEVTYSYKLENFDSIWFENTSAQYAVYSNLPSGEYTFKLKAQSKNSSSLPKTVSCFIKIEESLPPFYYSWWFILLGVILFFSIVYNLVSLKNKALKISKEELEEKIKIRTKKITKQNREKTVLLQEIHHRVKNNLQIINSLFNIQAHYTDSEETKAIFRESQNRILAMSKIHQSLYESNDFSKLNLKSYITNLVKDIKNSYTLCEEVELELNIEDNITIDLDSLIPFALITNEIISNALKYAFKERKGNIISIDIKQDSNKKTRIKIADNGIGLPDNFNWQTPTSMGVDLIKTLTEQLDGTITVNSQSGTNYLLIFVSK